MKFLIIYGLLIPLTIFSQTDKMSVKKKANGSDEIQLYNSQEITFPTFTAEDVMYIKKYDGTPDVFKLSDINKIVFDGIISDIENEISQLFKLGNYPNPFQGSTNIAYCLEKKAKVELKIFDMNGGLINVIVNDIQEPGDYSVIWNGTNPEGTKVSSAIYYYQLKVDNAVITRQTILVK